MRAVARMGKAGRTRRQARASLSTARAVLPVPIPTQRARRPDPFAQDWTLGRELDAAAAEAVDEQRERAGVLTQLRRCPERRVALEERQFVLVRHARRLAVTWAVIGQALGITAQSAHARYGRTR